jgi:hypothetical protein
MSGYNHREHEGVDVRDGPRDSGLTDLAYMLRRDVVPKKEDHGIGLLRQSDCA